MAIAIQGTFNRMFAAGSTTRVNTRAMTAGNTHIAVLVTIDGQPAMTSVTDDASGGSSVYTQRISYTAEGQRVEIWTTAAGEGKEAYNTTFTFDSGLYGHCILGSYSGVLALGTTATNTGTGADPTISLITQDSNNYVVSSLVTDDETTAPTTKTGTIRNNSVGGVGVGAQAVVDNTSALIGSVTCAVTHDVSPNNWAAAALELRSKSGQGTIRLGGSKGKLLRVGGPIGKPIVIS